MSNSFKFDVGERVRWIDPDGHKVSRWTVSERKHTGDGNLYWLKNESGSEAEAFGYELTKDDVRPYDVTLFRDQSATLTVVAASEDEAVDRAYHLVKEDDWSETGGGWNPTVEEAVGGICADDVIWCPMCDSTDVEDHVEDTGMYRCCGCGHEFPPAGKEVGCG